MKTSSGRGSWPGPSVSEHLVFLDTEHSRSEQQLSVSSKTNLCSSQYLNVFEKSSRKNSADSNSDTTNSCSSAKTVPQKSTAAASSSSSTTAASFRGGSDDHLVVISQRLQSSRSEDTLNYGRDSTNSTDNHRKRSTTSTNVMAGARSSDPFPQQPPSCEEEVFRVPVALHHSSKEAKKAAPPKVEKSGYSTIQVYAAYETGLANGTSLKLHVTASTTAREVIDLVVKQLNMAVLLKGRERPIYQESELKQFCLVAIIGARERCLRDDFKPLQLQNPWRKGRLYVRKKIDVLAALEHNNQPQLI